MNVMREIIICKQRHNETVGSFDRRTFRRTEITKPSGHDHHEREENSDRE
jgi:hypothetical protein